MAATKGGEKSLPVVSRKARVRGRTIAPKRLTQAERRDAAIYACDSHDRPRTRAECAGGPRPCPFVACRYHLYLDVKPNGAIKLNFPDLEVWELCESCALDVADRGDEMTHEEVGGKLNLTRERVRQLEVQCLLKLSSVDEVASQSN